MRPLTKGNKMKKFAVLAFIALWSSQASAIPIEIADFDAGHTLLNFDELATGTILDGDDYAGITFSSLEAPVEVVASSGSHSSPNYIGLPTNGWAGNLRIDFDNYVTQVGGILVEGDSWITAYDANDNLIDQVFWAFSGDLSDDFVGIDSGGTAISYAVFSGSFYAVDDFRFTEAPAPMVLGLLSLGLVGVGAATKRRNRKH